jgi:hypothetical protein
MLKILLPLDGITCVLIIQLFHVAIQMDISMVLMDLLQHIAVLPTIAMTTLMQLSN